MEGYSVWRMIAYVLLVRAAVYFLRTFVFKRKEQEAPRPPATIDDAQLTALQEKWVTAVKGLGATGKQYLVIGAGFLGSRIIGALVLRGEQHIRAFDMCISESLRKQYPQVTFIQGNVTNMEAVRAAVRGVDVVYSTFAVIRYYEALPHQLNASASVNVEGTNTVVEACVQENVSILVSTSTSNVCVYNQEEMQEFDENTPYVNPTNTPNHYAYTKAIAEQLVLGANGKPVSNGNLLHTGAIRPCSGIFGARDKMILQRVLDKGAFQYVTLGMLNWVYVDNCAWAHLLLERGLADYPKEVGGKAICVGNDYEGTMVDIIQLAKRHLPDIKVAPLPRRLLFFIADTLDFLRGLLKHRMPSHPELDMLSRACFRTGGMNYLLKSTLAQRLLGYQPVFTVPEAVMLSVAEYERGSFF